MMSVVLLDQVNLTNGTTELALSNVVSVEVVVVPCLYTLIDDRGVAVPFREGASRSIDDQRRNDD